MTGSYPQAQRRVGFHCVNGEAIELRFFPLQGVGVLVRDGQSHELQQQPAASGFRYEGGGYRVRGKGRELSVEGNGQAPLACTADPESPAR